MMRTVQSLVCCLGSLLVLIPPGVAQQQPPAQSAATPQVQTPAQTPVQTGPVPVSANPAAEGGLQRGGGAPLVSSWNNNFVTRRYTARAIEPINLRNSSRADQLIRAGKIYLSLQDTIAMALENNLDIELQRLGPGLADADLLRASAGGVIRGVQQNVTQGAQSAVSFVTGGFGGGLGGTGTGGGGNANNGGAQSGTLFQVTGTLIPNLDPSLNFNVTRSKSSSPQTNSFVSGTNALVVENLGFNANVQQQFLFGTGYNFSWNQNRIETNSTTNDLNPFYRGNFNLLLTQRLLQGFGIAVNNRNIRISRNNIKASDLTFKQQVIEITRSVINLYLDLLSFNETVKVRQKAVELANKLYEDNKKQVEIGTLAPIEVVRAEAQLAQAQTDLIVADTQVLQQETILKNALSRTGVDSPMWQDARIIPTDSLSSPSGDPVPDMQTMFELALSKRPEIEQTLVSIANTKIGLSGAKSQLLPSFDVFAQLTNNGLAGTINPLPSFLPRNPDPFLVGGLGRLYEQLLRRNFPDYSVGFQLSVPLRNRAAQADITNDTLRLRQQELNQQRQINEVKVQVAQALISLQQARASWDSSVKARRLQEQTLDAEQKKFALGSSTIFVVVQTQRDLTQAQANEVAAITSYSRAKNQLDAALGRTLEINDIDINEARSGEVKAAPGKLPVE